MRNIIKFGCKMQGSAMTHVQDATSALCPNKIVSSIMTQCTHCVFVVFFTNVYLHVFINQRIKYCIPFS